MVVEKHFLVPLESGCSSNLGSMVLSITILVLYFEKKSACRMPYAEQS